MFSHIMIGANDIHASKTFYDAVLGALGCSPGRIDEKGRVFYMTKTGVFGISKPINGEPACAANGGTIGFAADTPEIADAWYAAKPIVPPFAAHAGSPLIGLVMPKTPVLVM